MNDNPTKPDRFASMNFRAERMTRSVLMSAIVKSMKKNIDKAEKIATLRACSESLYKGSDKGQNNHPAGIVHLTSAVFPKPPRFVRPPNTSTHCWGSTANVCISLRFAASTSDPHAFLLYVLQLSSPLPNPCG
jgi:hypothetical protein